jgi:hypothetical protein
VTQPVKHLVPFNLCQNYKRNNYPFFLVGEAMQKWPSKLKATAAGESCESPSALRTVAYRDAWKPCAHDAFATGQFNCTPKIYLFIYLFIYF